MKGMGTPNGSEKRGFTVVEILIASAVLSLLLSFGYRVFFGVSATFQKGNWALAAQNKLRNGLAFVREEMQKASYRSAVRINGNALTMDGYRFSLTAADEITANATIAKWFICIPFRAGTSGAVYECELRLDAGRMLYNKQANEGSDPNERTYSNYLVVDNVASIALGLEEFDPDKPLAGKLVTFEVCVEHSDKVRHPGARVLAQTGAKVEVEVLRDL